MSRRGGPALYELLGRKPDGGADASSSPSTPSTPQRMQPREVRTQSNAAPRMDPAQARALVLAAVALTVVVIAYLIGVSRGERAGREAALNDQLVASQADPNALARSGANGIAPTTDASENRGSAGATTTAQQPTAADPTPPAATGALPPAVTGTDPRVAGLTYIVLASTLEPNAIKTVAFCREHGLDAWVVPDQNGRLREVTVLPGFERSERSSPKVRELEERIRNVGVLFKASGPGNGDFGDRYHKLFKG